MTLKQLATAYMELKYKAIPAHCRPVKKFFDNSANALRDSILAYFELKKIKAWPVATEGRYLREQWTTNVIGQRVQTQKGMFIPRSKKAKGAGDIKVVLPPNGRSLDIEIKYGRDMQREDQKAFQEEVEAMGGLYIIVKTFDDFIFQITPLCG